jgi:hypothetical protein
MFVCVIKSLKRITISTPDLMFGVFFCIVFVLVGACIPDMRSVLQERQ